MRLITLAMAALLCATGSATAQQSRGAGQATRIPVTVALVDQLPQEGVSFVILRRVSAKPYDVILLPADADARQLSSAVQALLTVRAVGGDTATTPATLRVRPGGTASGVRRQFPWAARVLADLRTAAPSALPDVGIVRSVVVWLPPQRRAARR